MIKIPIEQVNTKRLIELLHNQEWHKDVEIIPDYISKGDKKKENPKQYAYVAVQYNDGSEHPPCLRIMPQGGTFTSPNSRILNGFFWDIYGSPFGSVEEAIIAIAKAPKPYNVASQTFKLNI